CRQWIISVSLRSSASTGGTSTRTRPARSKRRPSSLILARPPHRLTLQQRRACGSFAGGACVISATFLEEIYAAIQYCISECTCIYDGGSPRERTVARRRGNCRGLGDGRFGRRDR